MVIVVIEATNECMRPMLVQFPRVNRFKKSVFNILNKKMYSADGSEGSTRDTLKLVSKRSLFCQ